MITEAETALQKTLPENMRIGLFVPCYISSIRQLELAERHFYGSNNHAHNVHFWATPEKA